MKKIITAVILMMGLSLQAWDIHQWDVNRQNSNNGGYQSSNYGSSGGYQGSSGNRYQYDLSNQNDRLNYNVDIGAQQRDNYNNVVNGTNGKVQQDHRNGQYGGGIY